jgi:hypothetical protein
LEGHREFAGYFRAEVRRSILVSESVSTDNDGRTPPGYQSGDVLDHDRLSEDGATDNIPDCAIG